MSWSGKAVRENLIKNYTENYQKELQKIAKE